MNHLIDMVTGGVCLFKVNRDMHFEALYANEACCKYFGTTKESFNERPYRIDDLIYPDDRSAAFQAIGVAMATKKPIDMELRIITHKDSYIWCKFNAGIQRYDKDNCPVFHAMFTDVSAIKRAQNEADLQREFLLKTLKNVPGPVFCTSFDDPFTLTVVSEDFTKITGYSRSEIFDKYGGNIMNFVCDDSVKTVRAAFENVPDSDTDISTSYYVNTKNGKRLLVYDRRRIIEMDDGTKSYIGMLTDRNSDEYFS